jgi:hypothetical protein
MPRPLFALLMVLPFLACKDPFRDQCTCTLMACFEGVSLHLAPKLDSARYRDFSVAVIYGDTVEAASGEWSFMDPGDFNFTSPRLRTQRPGHVGFRIDYKQDGSPKQIRVDTVLDWTSRVCNHCSGNSPSCKDDMAPSASVSLDLGTRL